MINSENDVAKVIGDLLQQIVPRKVLGKVSKFSGFSLRIKKSYKRSKCVQAELKR